jgi:hypothetical protein
LLGSGFRETRNRFRGNPSILKEDNQQLSQ